MKELTAADYRSTAAVLLDFVKFAAREWKTFSIVYRSLHYFDHRALCRTLTATAAACNMIADRIEARETNKVQ